MIVSSHSSILSVESSFVNLSTEAEELSLSYGEDEDLVVIIHLTISLLVSSTALE